MAACICPTVDVEGKPVMEWPEPTCPTHGYPDDEWRAGDPLRKHARVIEETLPHPWVKGETWTRRRSETPRETHARLYAEATTRPAFPLPLRPCPPRGMGQR